MLPKSSIKILIRIMVYHSLSGILLKAAPYLEKRWIYQLFTPTLGKISVSASRHRVASKRVILQPLMEGEWELKEGREFYWLEDFSIHSTFERLKSDLRHLMTAGKMALAIQRSQMPGKPAPLLYQLFSLYLRRLPEARNPEVMMVSFYLKILQHEGLLSEKLFEDPQASCFEAPEQAELQWLRECQQMGELLRKGSLVCSEEKMASLFEQKVHGST